MGRPRRRANRETGFTNIHLDERDRMDCEDVEFAVSDWLTDIRANPRPAINAEPARAHALGFRFPGVRARLRVSRVRNFSSSREPRAECPTWILRFRIGTYLLRGKRRIIPTCPFPYPEVVTKPTAGFVSFPPMSLFLTRAGGTSRFFRLHSRSPCPPLYACYYFRMH